MLVEFIVIIFEVSYGGGRHVQYIDPPSNVVTGLHLNFVTQPLCLIGLCLTKVSVGLFLLRLTPSPNFRRFIIATIIFTILSATGNFCKWKTYTRGHVQALTVSSDSFLPMPSPGLGLGQQCPRDLHPAVTPQVCGLLQLQRVCPD